MLSEFSHKNHLVFARRMERGAYVPITWQGEQYYWEHWGRMDQEKYRNHTETKKKWYAKFFPDRLVETLEGPDITTQVDELIKSSSRRQLRPWSHAPSKQNHKHSCTSQIILCVAAMTAKVLIAWIGNTDLRASAGESRDGAGPIANAVTKREFDEIYLLSDHKAADSKAFVKWLKDETGAQAKVWPVKLTGPTRFDEIYESAIGVLQSLAKEDVERHRTFHVSPGTPAMGAVWVLLAKTQFPAELIESSKEEGVRTISLPFEIAADYIVSRDIESDEEIRRLTRGLPPEAPEFTEIIHRCQAMKTVIAQARRVAVEDVPLLIQGESGTGKELFARAIHASSSRKSKPFVEVNCGAIDNRDFNPHWPQIYTVLDANDTVLDANGRKWQQHGFRRKWQHFSRGWRLRRVNSARITSLTPSTDVPSFDIHELRAYQSPAQG